MSRSAGDALADDFGRPAGRWELSIATIAAVAAVLAYGLCRLQAVSGSPICSPAAGSTVGLPCLVTGAVAIVAVVAAIATWRDVLRDASHAG